MLSAFALAIRNLRTKSRSEPSALYGKGVAGLQQQDFSVYLDKEPQPITAFHAGSSSGHLDKRNRQGTADEIAEAAIRSPRGRSGNSCRRDRSRSVRKIAISGLLAPYSTSSSDGRPPGSGLTRRAVLGCPRRLLQPLPVRLTLTRSAPVCHSSRCRRPYQPSMLSSSLTQRPQEVYCRWDLGEARNAARVCDS
jgi:hypothetical protein